MFSPHCMAIAAPQFKTTVDSAWLLGTVRLLPCLPSWRCLSGVSLKLLTAVPLSTIMKLHEHVAKHPAHLGWLRSSGCSLRDLVRGSHHRHLLEQLNGLPCLMSCSGKIMSIGWVKDKRPNFDQEFKRGASVRARKLVLASESAVYRRARRLDAGAPHKVSAQGRGLGRKLVSMLKE